MRPRMSGVLTGVVLAVLVALAAGCGGSSSSGSSGASSGGGHSGGTYTILANAAFGVADPAQNYTLEEWQLLIDTHDGLVQFKRVGGAAGTEDGARPCDRDPAADRRWQDVHLPDPQGHQVLGRHGDEAERFRAHVRAAVHGARANLFYSGIVGADACKPVKCDLSQGIVADDNAYTLTIHLTAADPEFLDKIALPFAYVVPSTTSPKNTGNVVPPGTGPYMWKSYDPNKEAVLVRNPYFKVWNADAQPPGYPDVIVEKYGLPISEEVTQVENGSADEVFDGDVIPSDRLNELNDPKYADQVHINPLTADWYFALNTKRPPFNNLQARQAINFAADRAAYVKIGGGTSLAQPTCQILPPNFPGYKPYCPYTAGGDTTTWTAPDLDKARQLVEQSGTKGMEVVVNSATDETSKALAEQMVSDLNAIGYKATTQLLNGSIQYPYVQNSKNLDKWDVAWSAWYQDYPAPSDFLVVLLGCGSIHPNSDASPNIAEFCEPSIDAKMQQAEQMGATDPQGANDLWAEIDHEVTDQAPWVDLYNPKQIDFLSERVQGYQWNPQWYILIDQQWIQ